MGFAQFFKLTIALLVVSQAYADDSNVQSLSEGACWYEQGEILKVASFNDRESVSLSRDDIEIQIENLLATKKSNKAITSDLSLHCGGYGSSLVIKSELDGKPICLWVRFNKGKLDVRSLGGLENTKSDLCDGYKWGELILGVKNPEQKLQLESDQFRGIIKSVSAISKTTLKVILDPAFIGREVEAMSELKKQMDLKYIELNLYQHPVGEVVSIK